MGLFSKKQNDASAAGGFGCLTLSDIRVQLPPMEKYDAIRLAGRMLVQRGSVSEEYIEAMVEREKTVTTYIGEGVAIPHGVGTARQYIKSTGLVVLQFAGEGVPFDDGSAKLLVGIAGLGEEHLPILQAVAHIIMKGDLLKELQETDDPGLILRALTGGEADA